MLSAGVNGGSVRAQAEPAPPVRWGDLRTRFVSAVVLAGAGLFGVFAGGAAWTLLLVACAAGLCVEWALLCALPGWRATPLMVAVLGCLLLQAAGHPPEALAALALGMVAVWLLAPGRGGRALAGAAGVLYLGFPAMALSWLRGRGPAGLPDVVFVMVVVWASDIGAYLIGRAIGGAKLAPRISPGKTWSGAMGGLLAALVAGLAVGSAFGAASLAAAGVALLLAAMSQAGDLLESGIKRRAGVKDSSRLIPGHGGLLDRLDGLLAAAPVAALIVCWNGAGGYLWG